MGKKKKKETRGCHASWKMNIPYNSVLSFSENKKNIVLCVSNFILVYK
jgi:hypothetical protein